MRIFTFVLALVALSASGCQVVSTLPGGDPAISGRGMILTIVNNTDAGLSVIRDGCEVSDNDGKPVKVLPGQHLRLPLRAWEAQSVAVSVALVARQDGRRIGAAQRNYTVYPDRKHSETWVVRRWDLQE